MRAAFFLCFFAARRRAVGVEQRTMAMLAGGGSQAYFGAPLHLSLPPRLLLSLAALSLLPSRPVRSTRSDLVREEPCPGTSPLARAPPASPTTRERHTAPPARGLPRLRSLPLSPSVPAERVAARPHSPFDPADPRRLRCAPGDAVRPARRTSDDGAWPTSISLRYFASRRLRFGRVRTVVRRSPSRGLGHQVLYGAQRLVRSEAFPWDGLLLLYGVGCAGCRS